MKCVGGKPRRYSAACGHGHLGQATCGLSFSCAQSTISAYILVQWSGRTDSQSHGALRTPGGNSVGRERKWSNHLLHRPSRGSATVIRCRNKVEYLRCGEGSRVMTRVTDRVWYGVSPLEELSSTALIATIIHGMTTLQILIQELRCKVRKL